MTFHPKLFICPALTFLLFHCASQDQQSSDGVEQIAPFPVVETGDRVIAPPEGVHPFYKKYINASGVVIVSSEKVPDAALLTVRKTILHLSNRRPDVHEAILQHHPRISIVAVSETASDLPEFGPAHDDPPAIASSIASVTVVP